MREICENLLLVYQEPKIPKFYFILRSQFKSSSPLQKVVTSVQSIAIFVIIYNF